MNISKNQIPWITRKSVYLLTGIAGLVLVLTGKASPEQADSAINADAIYTAVSTLALGMAGLLTGANSDAREVESREVIENHIPMPTPEVDAAINRVEEAARRVAEIVGEPIASGHDGRAIDRLAADVSGRHRAE
ncbi:hypothetical protein KRX51_03275 [Corynebacterium sp. TAE3-ERU12]|uniref:hypothetical protein n=1 Tax=Corynebacterium sp. TAE3-ERU12 TaxID=2849491 RepID=UPI001C4560AB|nr:hypothetical protein [Corynebacterium sp. TAE3-ERU12]MBV7294940.1 hypothetical protein [Corynebacterium sp. TAE3-ERU12]